jgi:hypothetical protein
VADLTAPWRDALDTALAWLTDTQARRAADGLAPVEVHAGPPTEAHIAWAADPHGASVATLGDCPACGGHQHRVETRTTERGSYDVAVPCECSPLIRACRRYTEARVPVLRGLAGASLEPREKDPRAGLDWSAGALEAIREPLRAWLRGLRSAPVLLLCGPTGSGKTHIAAGLVRHLLFSPSWMASPSAARWVRWGDYLDACKGDRPRRDELRATRLLVIDELSARAGDWGATELEDLIDLRTSAGAGLVLTTNLQTGDEVRAAVGDRAWSRIVGAGATLEVVAPDYRMRGRA